MAVSFFLVQETGLPGENHRPATSHWQTLSHNDVLTPWHEHLTCAGFELNVSGVLKGTCKKYDKTNYDSCSMTWWYNVVSSTSHLSGIRTHNCGGDRYLLDRYMRSRPWQPLILSSNAFINDDVYTSEHSTQAKTIVLTILTMLGLSKIICKSIFKW